MRETRSVQRVRDPDVPAGDGERRRVVPDVDRLQDTAPVTIELGDLTRAGEGDPDVRRGSQRPPSVGRRRRSS